MVPEYEYVDLGNEYYEEDQWYDAKLLNSDLVIQALKACGRRSLRFKDKTELSKWKKILKGIKNNTIPLAWVNNCIMVYGDINRRSYPTVTRSFGNLGKWITNQAKMEDWIGKNPTKVRNNNNETGFGTAKSYE